MFDPRAENTELLKSFIQGVISCKDNDFFLQYLLKHHNKIEFNVRKNEIKKKKAVVE